MVNNKGKVKSMEIYETERRKDEVELGGGGIGIERWEENQGMRMGFLISLWDIPSISCSVGHIVIIIQ